MIQAAAKKQYRNNPVLVTMKALEAAGLLNLSLPDGANVALERVDDSLTATGAATAN